MNSDDRATIVDMEKVHFKDQVGPVEYPEVIEVPDGGLRAWLALIGSFLGQFSSWGYLSAFGVYQDYYVRVYLSDYSASSISWIGSAQIFLVLAMGIPAGRAFDAGYFYHITIAGSFLFAFSLFMLSLSHPQHFAQVFLAQGVANGIAIGMIYVPSLAIISHYFNRYRTFGMGISAAGAAVGGALHPIMLNQLIHQGGRDNFHNSVRASAGFNLGVLLIAVFLMKPRRLPQMQDDNLLSSFRTFMQEPAYVLMTLGMVLAIIGMFFPLFFLQLYAIKKGISPKLAFYSLTALNCGSVVGRIVPNLFADRCGVTNALLLSVLSTNIIVFAMLGVKTAVGVMIFSVAFGFCSGAYSSLLGPVLSAMAKKESEIGARIGISFAIAGIGGLVGNPIAGVFLTSSFEWWKPILFAGLTASLAAAFFFATCFFLAKERGTMFV